MAISLSGHARYKHAKEAAEKIAAQQKKAQAGEAKRKGRSSLFGKIGGSLLGAAAVGLTGLTGGLAAPLVMGVAASLGKKWADEASRGASPFGKLLKSPGQVDKIKVGGMGYGREDAESFTKGLRESRKSTWSPESMFGDIAGSYLTAGLSGRLTSGAKTLFSGDKGSIAKALGGKQGAVGGGEGVKQSLGLCEFGADPTMDYQSLEGTISPEKYDALVTSRQTDYIDDADDFWDLGFAQGGQVPQMDQNTLIGLALLADMGKQKKSYDDTPLEEEKQQTISEMFASKGKTLGGNNTKSIAQMLGR